MRSNGTIKKVLKHLKSDTKEFKESIQEDAKLSKQLKKKDAMKRSARKECNY